MLLYWYIIIIIIIIFLLSYYYIIILLYDYIIILFFFIILIYDIVRCWHFPHFSKNTMCSQKFHINDLELSFSATFAESRCASFPCWTNIDFRDF